MPRKDPNTGCEVLTLQELFADEDKREGKEPGTALREMIDDMDRAMREEEARYRDPAVALDAILTAVQEWNDTDSEGRIEAPKTVLEVLEVVCVFGVRRSNMSLKVRAEKQDGTHGVFKYESWSTSGGREEQPESETNLSWEES